MIITKHIKHLKSESHKQVLIECDYKLSFSCKKTWKVEFRTIAKYRKHNKGKDICLQCSRKLKNSGNKNGNSTYVINQDLFSNINTEEQAYLLGWIASDGTIRKGTITIEIHKRDRLLLEKLRNIVSPKLPIKLRKSRNTVSFSFNSQKIVEDVCKVLNLKPGKKSSFITFPYTIPTGLYIAFIRGYFDGDGCIVSPSSKAKYPKCDITSNSKEILESINKLLGIPSSLTPNRLHWSGNNALDVLGKLYDNSSIYLPRKQQLYQDWSGWVPSLSGAGTHGKDICFKWNKTKKNAIAPFKVRASDAGYDLTLIEKVKEYDDVELYTTGIKVEPSYGWWFLMSPRSSLAKTGYMLANSVGIIDRTYVGEILVALRKINKKSPTLHLPCKAVQLIPMPAIHTNFIESDKLEESDRGQKGFGSSDK